MKIILSIGLLSSPMFAQARDFTLNTGLSYRLYESLNTTATPTTGGTVKSVVHGNNRLDCYSISRYACVLTTNVTPTNLPYNGLSLTISEAGFQRALFDSMNANETGGVKTISHNDYSLTCTKNQNCVVLIRASQQPPQPVPVPTAPACTVRREACTYAGYCYFYDYRTGTYAYGYSPYCSGFREVNSCGNSPWECWPY